eukprot:3051159-Rhodomonas_salina.1
MRECVAYLQTNAARFPFLFSRMWRVSGVLGRICSEIRAYVAWSYCTFAYFAPHGVRNARMAPEKRV